MLRIATTIALALGLFAPVAGGLPASAAPAAADTVIVQIDNPSNGEANMSPGWIAGWAVDTASTSGTGIDQVNVFMDGDQHNGAFLGTATYDQPRNDVAQALGNPNFTNSGFTLSLAGMMIPPGPHSFTVVAHSAVSNVEAAASVSGVTVVPSGTGYPPGYVASSGLPQIGNEPGQPLQQTPPSGAQNPGGLQVTATLANVSFLLGQDYYNAFNSYNGYLAPGLVLPNGTVVDGGTTLSNGQLYWNGGLMPIDTFITPISPVTLSNVGGPVYRGTINYGTVLPGGTVVPYNAPYTYWNGFNWSTLPYGTSQIVNPTVQIQGSITSDEDVIYVQPYGGGYRYAVNIPAAAPNGYVWNGPGPWWMGYNWAGNGAMQGTLVAHVTQNGQPVQGAQVTYNGYPLPPTDQNGNTSATVMFPVNVNQGISGTVTATYNGMTASIPVIVDYNGLMP